MEERKWGVASILQRGIGTVTSSKGNEDPVTWGNETHLQNLKWIVKWL